MKQKRPFIPDGDCTLVPLTKGYTAIVDTEDVTKIEGKNWFALVTKNKGTLYSVYAARNVRASDGKVSQELMHRIIAGTPDGLDTDHEDGNGLNNRKNNLRPATRSENSCNSKLQKNNTTGFKGVSKAKDRNRYCAYIKLHGRNKYLGSFNTKEEARDAYIFASKELHGKFGRLI